MAAPHYKIQRRLGCAIRMRRGDMIRIAGQHQQLGIRDLLLPGAGLLDRAEPALLGGDDQRRAGDLRQIGADIGAGDRPHEAELGRHRGAAHELRPPFEAFRRKRAAEPVAHVLPRPVFDAVRLEIADQFGHALGGAGAQRRRRADDGQRHDAARAGARQRRARSCRRSWRRPGESARCRDGPSDGRNPRSADRASTDSRAASASTRRKPRMSGRTTRYCRASFGTQAYQASPLSALPCSIRIVSGWRHGSVKSSTW